MYFGFKVSFYQGLFFFSSQVLVYAFLISFFFCLANFVEHSRLRTWALCFWGLLYLIFMFSFSCVVYLVSVCDFLLSHFLFCFVSHFCFMPHCWFVLISFSCVLLPVSFQTFHVCIPHEHSLHPLPLLQQQHSSSQ